MTIQHHLNDQLLMGYASGALPEAFDLLVATQISMSDEARSRLATFEEVGGGLLDGQDVCEISADCLENVLAQVSNTTPEKKKSEPMVEGVFPAPLQQYVGGDIDAVKWRSLGGGVKQAILKTSGEATARLLYIPAGTAVPDHGHEGTELTLVLQGAFSDEVDRFARGDVEIADEDLEHTPKAEPGLPCICLAATDAPLRFNDLLPRLLQPIFKI